MNLQRTLILFAVLIAMLWIFGIIVESRKGAAESEYLFPKLQKLQPKITSVDLETEDGTFQFRKQEDGAWTLTEPDGDVQYRVSETKIDQLIYQVRNATKADDTDFTQNRSTEKLDEPPVIVTLESEDNSWTLKLGRRSGDEKYVAVLSSERPNRIYVMEISNIDEALTEDMKTFRDTTLLDVTSKNARTLSIAKRGGKEFVVEYDVVEDLWRFQRPKNFGVADVAGDTKDKKNRPGLSSLIDAVGNIRVAAAKDFVNTKTSILAPGKEELKITTEYKEGKGFDQKKTVTRTLLISPDVKGKRYVRLVGDDYLAQVSSDVVEKLLEAVDDPEMYRSRDLVFPTPVKAKGLEIADGRGNTVRLLKPDTDWMLIPKDTKDAVTADAKVVNDLLEVLHGDNKIKQFLSAKAKDAALGLDNPKQLPKVDFYFDGVAGDAKNPKLTAKEPDVSLLFSLKQGDVVYVKRTRGAEVDRFAYPASILEELKLDQGYLGFLKRELPPLTESNVAKITIERSGGSVILESETMGWKMIQPKNLPKRGPDNFQVTELIRTLSKLEVVDWLAQVNKDTKLSQYGLDSPSLAVTIELKAKDKEKPETVVYKFGRPRPSGKKGVPALVSSRDTVFLAKTSTYDDLRTLELRDRTVMGIETDKIREVVISGWVQGGLHRLMKVSRPGPSASWNAKLKVAPQDQLATISFFPLKKFDATKLDGFLGNIGGMKAKRFLDESGGLRRDQKKDGEYALSVEIKLEKNKAGKEPIYTLHLGRMNDQETGYFAELVTNPNSINPLPGVVLLLDKSPWEDILKEQHNYFSKE
ncbi:MAG: DUF4340 domain-containing protein [Gemmataceae bacterium]